MQKNYRKNTVIQKIIVDNLDILPYIVYIVYKRYKIRWIGTVIRRLFPKK